MNDDLNRACKCISSNEPQEWQTDSALVLELPWEPGRTASIEPCIATAIQGLWTMGIVTVGSCCGHGAVKPSVVIEHAAADGERAVALLAANDHRQWDVLGWVITNLNERVLTNNDALRSPEVEAAFAAFVRGATWAATSTADLRERRDDYELAVRRDDRHSWKYQAERFRERADEAEARASAALAALTDQREVTS